MNAALIVGGDQIEGLKQVLAEHGIAHVRHWSGRKVGDSRKVIPRDTGLVVLVTDWVSHSFTRKIKQDAARRSVRIIYTPNATTALAARLQPAADSQEGCCQQRERRQPCLRRPGFAANSISLSQSGVSHVHPCH